jgi:ubiquinone biosynthesis protein
LQDDVRPFSYAEVEQIVRRELGKPPQEAFAAFDLEPLAAASTAQVHAATLLSGERVVVKVRRPDIEVTVKGDLNVIQDVLHLAERRVALEPAVWFKRVVSGVRRECPGRTGLHQRGLQRPPAAA